MKVKTGIAVGMLWATFSPAGCSLLQKPCQDPLSCQCPTNQNPACAPFPNDDGDNPSTMAKKPIRKTGDVPSPDGGTDR
jgi:hypothetical protein